MQTTVALRKFSINSIAATFAVLLALAAGGAGGYLLKSQVASTLTKAGQPSTATQSTRVAPPRNLPEETVNVTDAVDRAIARAANATRPGDSFSPRTGD